MHQREVNWGKECHLIGGCRLNGPRGTSTPFCRHPPILASQEQLALRGLKHITYSETCLERPPSDERPPSVLHLAIFKSEPKWLLDILKFSQTWPKVSHYRPFIDMKEYFMWSMLALPHSTEEPTDQYHIWDPIYTLSLPKSNTAPYDEHLMLTRISHVQVLKTSAQCRAANMVDTQCVISMAQMCIFYLKFVVLHKEMCSHLYLLFTE
jgi:hypothetical protein